MTAPSPRSWIALPPGAPPAHLHRAILTYGRPPLNLTYGSSAPPPSLGFTASRFAARPYIKASLLPLPPVLIPPPFTATQVHHLPTKPSSASMAPTLPLLEAGPCWAVMAPPYLPPPPPPRPPGGLCAASSFWSGPRATSRRERWIAFLPPAA